MAKGMNELLNQAQERYNVLAQQNAELKAVQPIAHSDVIELAEEHVFRLNHVVYLAALLPHGEHDLFDELDGFVEQVFDALFPGEMDDTYNDADMGWVLIDKLVESGKRGFIARVETPDFVSDTSYSWGIYKQRWIYGETMNDVINQAIAFCIESRKGVATGSCRKCPTLGPSCRGCPDCMGIVSDLEE